jgi:hypothetical protein
VNQTKTADRPGWCALNSAHPVHRGDVVGRLVAAGAVLGWACTDCTRRAGRE